MWMAMMGAALVLGATATGAAAAPFGIGTTSIGSQPSVAVTSDGTAYVAFVDTSTTTDPSGAEVGVCVLPAGATTCSQFADLAPGTPLDSAIRVHPFVFIDAAGDPEVVITSENGAGAAEVDYMSVDGGAQWAGPTVIGDMNALSAAFDPALGGGIVFGAKLGTNYLGVDVNGADVRGSAAGSAHLSVAASEALGTISAVSDTSAGVAVVHVWDGGTSTGTKSPSYAYYSGPALAGASSAAVVADADSAANYSVGNIGDGGGALSLAGGPAGIFLLEGQYPDLPMIRPWNGTSFGKAAVADCNDHQHNYGAGIQAQALSEDPSTGALQLVYVEGSGGGTDYVQYTELAGGKQSIPVNLATLSTPAGAGSPAIGSDGTAHPGLVVWYDGNGDQLTADWLPPVTITGCQSGPSATGAFSGVSRGHPNLTLKLGNASGGPKLSSIMIGLPHGLSFNHKAFAIHRHCHRTGKKRKCNKLQTVSGLSVSGGKVRSTKLDNGKLAIVLRKASRHVRIHAGGRLIAESQSLQTKVRKGKHKTLEITVKTVNTAHHATTLKLTLKAG